MTLKTIEWIFMSIFSLGQGPNAVRREQVAELFRGRDELDPESWMALAPAGVRLEVVDFLVRFLSAASGLPFGCARPRDTLRADLQLEKILWNDWDLDLVEQFERRFAVSLGIAKILDECDSLGDRAHRLSLAAGSPGPLK